MGLDTTHNCWHGPYSSFNRFRHSLAEQIGISLDDYCGYNDNGTKDLGKIKHDIRPLLNHSDCDGHLTPLQAKRVAKGLDNILNNLNNEIQFDYNFVEKITEFRDGCLLAFKNKEKIEFR